MLKRFLQQLHSLDAAKRKILVAASGGLDSTVLLDLMVKSKHTFAVAHANFQLRGNASVEDESWVMDWAAKHSVPFYVRRFETNNYAKEKGLSIQLAARELRYAWFEELAVGEGFDIIATAHHLNDQIETFLLNATRGTGLAGLLGIPLRNGRIVRPMLNFSREEIEQYARENHLAWREDASNAGDDYHRNFVRHHVVPKLKELNPSLEETFARNLERLGAESELMNREMTRLHEQHVVQAGHQTKIAKVFLNEFSNPAPVLLGLIRKFGFNLDQCREMIAASGGQPGARFLTHSHQLVIDRDNFIVIPLSGDWSSVNIESGQRHAELGPWRIVVEDSSECDLLDNRLQAVLAANQLQFPLLWRRWKPGDYFYPLGMAHRKKLSDFLIDNKISMAEKETITVLESGGEIAWVVGHRIDNRFRLLDDTQDGLVFTLQSKV